MTASNQFNSAQLTVLQGYLDAAAVYYAIDDDAGVQNALHQYYSYQATLGRGYASLADGVLNNQGFEGQVAVDMFRQIAGSGITAGTQTKLMLSLAQRDLSAMGSDGFWPTMKAIEGYHAAAYKDLDLPIFAWGGAAFARYGTQWDGGKLTADEISDGSHDAAFSSISPNDVIENLEALGKAGLEQIRDAVAAALDLNPEATGFTATVNPYAALAKYDAVKEALKSDMPSLSDLGDLAKLLALATADYITNTAAYNELNSLADAVVDGLASLLAGLPPGLLGGALGPLPGFGIPFFMPNFDNSGAPQPNPRYEPLVLDLNGSGIQTTSKNAGIAFDVNNDGFKLITGWVAPGDGLLVYDPTNSGAVADGSQLFGTSMRLPNDMFALDGFEALGAFDSNSDGKITSSDTNWSGLRVWVDSNQNGMADSGELLTMSQAGVGTLNLSSTASGVVDPQDNLHLRIGSYVDTASLSHEMDDISFATIPGLTTPTHTVAVPSGIAALPDLRGYGTVTTLHQAMAQDQSHQLQALVEQFIAATNDTDRNSLVDQIIYLWAGVSTVAANSRGLNFDARKLTALEKFTGRRFVDTGGSSNPSSSSVAGLTDSFGALHRDIYAGLMSQTVLEPLFQGVRLAADSGTGNIYWDFAAAETSILSSLSSNRTAALTLLGEFNMAAREFGLDLGQGFATFRSHLVAQGSDVASTFLYGGSNVQGTVGNEVITAWAGHQAVYGNGGNDTLIGAADSVTLVGGGSPVVFVGAGPGSETFIGGSSDTFIASGGGTYSFVGNTQNSVYIFTKGGGHATITEYGGEDTLMLGSGLTAANTSLTVSGGSDLLITDGISGDLITVKNLYTNGYHLTLVYGDGTKRLLPAGLTLTGSAGTSILGTSYGDTLIGGSGTETLNGSGGNDLFIAGTGTETLIGGSGNDTYSYAAGAGTVTITDSGGTNTLKLGSTLTPLNVSLATSNGTDLLITDGTTGDLIRITSQFTGGGRFQTLVYGDGSTLNLAQGIVVNGASGSAVLGTAFADTLVGGSGTETLTGSGGNDTFIAGTGAETLIGGFNNDTYSYASGAGAVTIVDTGGLNTLKLGTGLTAASTTLAASANGSDLLITDGVSGDLIVIQSHLGGANVIKTLVYGDNSTASLQGLALAIASGATFLGGTTGNDTLAAATGSQTLAGNGGNDTYISGSGTETFFGGTGNDLYSYASGAGGLVIADTGGTNTLKLGSGLVAASLTMVASSNGSDLLITDGVSGDLITLQNQLSASGIIQTVVYGDGSTGSLRGLALTMPSGGTLLNGTPGNDTLVATSGTQTLIGNGGNDTFISGTGSFKVFGGTGNDTYSYASGTGAQTIADNGGTNTLKLGSGLNAASMTLALGANGSDLLITDGVSGDLINIQAGVSGRTVQTLVYGDGSTMNLAGALTLAASGGTVEWGTAANDTLVAGSGTATLMGKGGNDTFIAGTGTATLIGGAGNDTYSYASGAGAVTISDAGGANTLKLGTGLTAASITMALATNGSDLLVSDGVSGDLIVVQSGVSGRAIQKLIYGDGSTNNLAGVLTLTSSSGTEEWGTTGNDTLVGVAGSATLMGKGGNDTFIAGSGTQTLLGSTGNDTYSYASGSGVVTIADNGGTNVLKLGSGLNASNVLFGLSANRSDLLISDGVTGDLITIAAGASGRAVQTLIYGDGTTKSLTGVVTLSTGTGVIVLGTNAAETFVAGSGSQTVISGDGSDAYSYAVGNGALTIIPGTGGNAHVLTLGSGITSTNILFQVLNSGSDLLITDGTTGDLIAIPNQYLWVNGGYNDAITSLVYDGVTRNLLTTGLPITVLGSGSFTGTPFSDTIYGGTGTQTLSGGGGANTFIAGTGSQTIISTNDGADSYSYSAGNGALTIIPGNNGYNHTLTLGGGITSTNILFQVLNSGSDLLITDGTTGDLIYVPNQYLKTTGFYNDEVTSLIYDGVTKNLTTTGLPITIVGNGSFTGTPFNDTIYGGTGTETLDGGGGANTFIAGTGSQTIISTNDSADVYSYAAGNGSLEIITNNVGFAHTLFLGAGLTSTNVMFALAANGSDLLITDGTSGDLITLQNQYLSSYGNYYNAVGTLIYGNGATRSLVGSGLLLAEVGNGSFSGTPWNDTIVGGTGTETLDGGGGSNTFIAGTGSQTIISTNDATDSYSYSAGNGALTIIPGTIGYAHTLTLGSGITSTNVLFQVLNSGSDLLITDGTTGDLVYVPNQYFVVGGGYNDAITALVYGGVTKNLLTTGLPLTGVGNGSFGGTPFNDTIYGGTGTETLNGGGGSDTIVGGTGTQTLYGGGGTNTFVAGSGSETIISTGDTNDVYSYAAGNGNLTIIPGTTGNHTLFLGTGLTSTNVMFGLAANGSDLLITDGTSGDLITIKDQYYYSQNNWSNAIATLIYGNGATRSLVGTGFLLNEAGSGSFTGSPWDDTIIGGTGTQTLLGGGGTNTFVAGTGSQTIISTGDTNDRYSYSAGNGNLTIVPGTTGNHTLFLGSGLTSTNVVFALAANGSDLLITDGTSGDLITIKDQYYYSQNNWSNAIATLIYGNGATRSLVGSGFQLTEVGDGSFTGSPWNDTIIGGTGTQTLYGGGGTNTFVAGTGIQTIISAGDTNDRYSYAAGNGNLTIIPGTTGNHTLFLGTGLTSTNVMFALAANGSDLLITDGTSGDLITIKDQYYYSQNNWSNAIATLIYGNGATRSLVGTGFLLNEVGDGSFTGSPWSDTIIGGTGTQTLYGGGGTNTFVSGVGSETIISAGDTNDVYSYAAGNGNLTIIPGTTGNHTLFLGTGLTSTNVMFGLAANGSDLLITDGTSGDMITIKDQYYYSQNNWSNAIVTMIYGNGATRSLVGSGFLLNEVGDGSFTGSPWGDTIVGGVGTETLYGGGGVNTFVAGTGSQTIISTGDGADSYSYSAGNGALTIMPGAGGYSHTLTLGSGVTSTNILFQVLNSGSDLLITDGTTGDLVHVPNQYLVVAGSYVDAITSLVYGGVTKNLTTTGLPITVVGSGSFKGTPFGDTIYGGTGTETLDGGGGANTFIAGTGSQTIISTNDGADSYSYSAGNGALTIIPGAGGYAHTLTLGSGITSTNIMFQVVNSGSDLLITDGTTGDLIYVPNQYLVVGGGYNDEITSLVYGGVTKNLTNTGLPITVVGGGFFKGTPFGDTIYGGTGTETLDGGGGANTFIAGTGSQTIISTNDTADSYSYAAGNGALTIIPGNVGYAHTLTLGTGITSTNILFQVLNSGSDLLITDGTTGDLVYVPNQYLKTSGSYSDMITSLIYGGVTKNLTNTGLPITVVGGGSFVGTPFNDTIYGGTGTETLDGGGGANTFIAGTGSQTIISTNDTSDSYSYAAGSGALTIIPGNNGYAHTLTLGSGITSTNIMFQILSSGSDLLITDGTTGDLVYVPNQYLKTSGSYLDAITSLVYGGVTKNLTTTGLPITVVGNGAFVGTAFNDTIYGGIGTETLDGGGGANTFIAGTGSQTIISTNDTTDSYSYSAGNGALTIIPGNVGYAHTLTLGSGITTTNIMFQVLNSGSDLLITDGATGDLVYIPNQYLKTGAAYNDEITSLIYGGVTKNLTTTGLPLQYSGNGAFGGTPYNDTIYGGAGTETLSGYAGNNTFIVGSGAETLIGGSDSDTYSYASGAGLATIIDSGGANTLKLGSGLNATNILFAASANGSDLLITDGTTGDLITLKNQYLLSGVSYPNQVQTLVFGDASTLSLTGALKITVTGDGAFGGTPFNDTIYGGTGTETLNGYAGNNTFIAGSGVETLIGSTGNDTYSYTSGSGLDTIIESGGTNTLKLGSGLNSTNILFAASADGSDLLIRDGTTGDLVTLKNQYLLSGASYPNQVQTLVFGDASTMSLTGALKITAVGNGSFSGTPFNDTIYGGTGTETLNGYAGNNTFIAGSGVETLIGSTGNDTYSYTSGAGLDTIVEGGGTNILKLGSGLNSTNILFAASADGSDLLIRDGTTGDLITLKNQYLLSGGVYPGQVQTLVFGDASTTSLTGALKISASGDGAFGGTPYDDTIYGGTGTETLNGYAGNNTFIAGTGVQTIIGGSGSDLYSYTAGSGQDTIIDSGGTDTLQLGSGIATDQIWFQQQGNDLLVSRIGTTDNILIKDWYSGSSNQVDTFRTSDGHVLANTQVANLVNAMAGLSPPSLGQTTLPTDYATTLEPVISANWS